MKIELDNYQMKAINIKCKNTLVVAAPGSGKTTVIINRVNHLIEERKARIGNIIVITFTRAAAENMKSRYKNIFSNKKDVIINDNIFRVSKKLIFIVIVDFKKRRRLLSASGNRIFAEENSCFKGLKALCEERQNFQSDLILQKKCTLVAGKVQACNAN